MVESATTPVYPNLQLPPLPSRSGARIAAARPASPSTHNHTLARKSLPLLRTPITSTHPPKTGSLELLPLPETLTIPLSPSRISSLVAERINEDDTLRELRKPRRAKTVSSKSSYESSVCTSTTIRINPSRSLQAMQSVGSDVGHLSCNADWRRTSLYLRESQVSLFIPEVYKPTGLPQSIFDQLDAVNHTAVLDRFAPSTSDTETCPNQVVRNGSQVSDELESSITLYGPSNQDMQDLIERQTKWDEEQKRKTWHPLKRFASLSKEFTGGLVRSLSKGKAKKGFETRLKQIRATSDQQREEGTRKPNILRRHHTIGGTHGRRRFRLSDESDVITREAEEMMDEQGQYRE